MKPIFKIVMLIYQSKVNSEAKILFGRITHYLDRGYAIQRRGIMLDVMDTPYRGGVSC